MLAACGNQQPKKAASSSAAVSTSRTKATSKSVKLAWSDEKSQKLDAFMKDFSQTKAENFTKADRTAHTKWQGLDLSKVYAAKQPVTIDNQKTPVTWLPKHNRGSRSQQNVVAVYVDDQAKTLFLFTLTAKAKARVLISQTAPKANIISTTDTQDQAVAKGFAAITAGRPATLTSKVAASAASAASSSKAAASSTASATSSSAAAASSSKTPAKTNHKPVFSSQFWHTWYTADQYQSPTLSFTVNAEIVHGTSQPVYDVSEESQSDLKIAQTAGANPDPVRSAWGSATVSADGNTVSVRGWYQANGGPIVYKISTFNLGGQPTKVLETCEGAGWHSANYFLTPALAKQYQNQVFPGQPPKA
ncbi:DUF4767 domain-containing protein [Lacticaseibacillus jixiensis]|uniref:DUF4767 domain-containing protein n=1 Tax=Lacticaseibacillus jixiensis TaxID=3231926 RepID=UPI0036F195D0